MGQIWRSFYVTERVHLPPILGEIVAEIRLTQEGIGIDSECWCMWDSVAGRSEGFVHLIGATRDNFLLPLSERQRASVRPCPSIYRHDTGGQPPCRSLSS